MTFLRSVPREIVYFAGVGAYGFVIGIAYWFLTYETAGTVMLVVFGAGAILFATFLGLSLRRRDRDADGEPLALEPGAEGAFGQVPDRVPSGSLAPLEVGFGIALAALSLVFGIWMLIGAVMPLGAGAVSWLRGAERELAASRLDEAEADTPDRASPDRPAPDSPVSAARPAPEPPSA
jgi:hypothetical protein